MNEMLGGIGFALVGILIVVNFGIADRPAEIRDELRKMNQREENDDKA